MGAIGPKLERAEIDRAKRKPPKSLDAYDYYLRGLGSFNQWTKEGNTEALSALYHAIEPDPDYSTAYGVAAYLYDQRIENGWMVNREEETAEAARLARRAVELGGDDTVALCFAGLAMGWVVRDIESGAAFVDQALALNSNMAAAWSASGWMKLCLGELDTAMERSERAMRLSPFDQAAPLWQAEMGLIHFCAGRYADASLYGERVLRIKPNSAFALRVLSASRPLVHVPVKGLRFPFDGEGICSPQFGLCVRAALSGTGVT